MANERLCLRQNARRHPTVDRIKNGKPKSTRVLLETILFEDPEAFRKIVPQGIDEQTGLYSKKHFETRLLHAAISKANESGIPLSYVLFDLDKFHDFNDRYGYSKGDEAIVKLVELMNSVFRTEDGVLERWQKDRRKYQNSPDLISRLQDNGHIAQGRVGYGEEFAVILSGCDERTALEIAQRVLDGARRIRIPYGNETVGFTVSGGISEYLPTMTPEQLKQNANSAVKYSKHNGRDRITLFSEVPTEYKRL